MGIIAGTKGRKKRQNNRTFKPNCRVYNIFLSFFCNLLLLYKIITIPNNGSFSGFNLSKNWDSQDMPQFVQIVIKLDETDEANISLLKIKTTKMQTLAQYYGISVSDFSSYNKEFTIGVFLNADNNFSVHVEQNNGDFGYHYLENYNLYKELISIYNIENPDDLIPNLHESLSILGGFRNYNQFNSSVSLSSDGRTQARQIKNATYDQSITTVEQSAPTIFSLVALTSAQAHYDLQDSGIAEPQRTQDANGNPILKSINSHLSILNLKCVVELTDLHSWQYSFKFIDIKRNEPLTDINRLSAGQKSLVHLIFEAYGRGAIKGGLVIIDEPEIHLHHQLQSKYLEIIYNINMTQHCQYILVTHSESFINSKTIGNVKRLALDENNSTVVKIPELTSKQKTLVKILDNSKATYALFSKKVVLVEGGSDRYFFSAVLQTKYPQLTQEISILDIAGKKSYDEWRTFFECLGLTVYHIADQDAAFEHCYPGEKVPAGKKEDKYVKDFLAKQTDLGQKIKNKYKKKIYILKDGDLEYYLDISKNKKGIESTIEFCNTKLQTFLGDKNSAKAKELLTIFKAIIKT